MKSSKFSLILNQYKILNEISLKMIFNLDLITFNKRFYLLTQAVYTIIK